MAAFAPALATPALPAGALPLDVRLMQTTANAVLAAAALLLCAAAAAWALRLPVWRLQGIAVEGDVSRNSAATLRANAAARLSGNFLTIDLLKAREAFESVPWVRRAIVRRVWPNRLAVKLEEHVPVALWAGSTADSGDEAEDRLVNSFGEVFEANAGDVEDLPLATLAGPDGAAPQMLAMLRRLAGALAPLRAGDIERLQLSPRGAWEVTLDSGAQINLGRGSDDEVLARTSRFVQTMPRVTATYQRPLHSADLRHPDGFAVRLKGLGTAVPAPAGGRRP